MAKHSEPGNGKFKYIIIFLIIVVLISGGIYFFMKNKNDMEQPVNSSSESINKETSIKEFKDKLQTNGLTISEEIQKSATLIGAEEGYGYIIDDVSIEIYRFDENSSDDLTKSNIKSAKNEEKITMPTFNNMEMKVKYNNGLCLVNYENHPNKDKILEIFNNL